MYRILLCGSKPTKIYFCPRLLLSNFIESPCRSRKKYREEKRRDQWWVPGRSTEQTEYKCFLLLLLGSSVEKENLFFFNCFETNSWYACTGGRHTAGRLCLSSQAASKTALLQRSYSCSKRSLGTALCQMCTRTTDHYPCLLAGSVTVHSLSSFHFSNFSLFVL